MLTLAEKLLFAFLTVLSLTDAWITFRMVYAVIRRGRGEWPTWSEVSARAGQALVQWLGEGSMWKARPISRKL